MAKGRFALPGKEEVDGQFLVACASLPPLLTRPPPSAPPSPVPQNAKVCVVGGAGGIGQPMSMLLSMNPDVTHVSVFDMVGAPGVAADLGHIDSPASVSGHGMSLKEFTGDDKIDNQADFQAAGTATLLLPPPHPHTQTPHSRARTVPREQLTRETPSRS